MTTRVSKTNSKRASRTSGPNLKSWSFDTSFDMRLKNLVRLCERWKFTKFGFNQILDRRCTRLYVRSSKWCLLEKDWKCQKITIGGGTMWVLHHPRALWPKRANPMALLYLVIHLSIKFLKRVYLYEFSIFRYWNSWTSDIKKWESSFYLFISSRDYRIEGDWRETDGM